MVMAGQLRQRIVMQSMTSTADEYGEPAETWTAFATVWASVTPLAGREYMQAKAENVEVTTRVLIRMRTGITPATTRVTWTDPMAVAHIYDIKDVIPDPTFERHLQLMCREIT